MKITKEQLIEIAKQDLTPEQKTDLTDIDRFILLFDIKPGKHKVKNRVIKKCFKMWHGDSMPDETFFSYFSQYFEQKRKEFYRYYELNYKPMELTNAVDNYKNKK